jgi:hypothetical protein
MQCFIWERTGDVTHHCHDEAGVVIFALNLPHARTLFANWQVEHHERGKQDKCGVYVLEPDDVVFVEPGTMARLYVFPDKGCC